MPNEKTSNDSYLIKKNIENVSIPRSDYSSVNNFIDIYLSNIIEKKNKIGIVIAHVNC